ncbi:hypothetical protein C7I87_11040 [Mesorhizobium sp. SARCC-RB16n]|uniref:hypothetical protein n=1 Tax=Mesorhizobium sp. SARCC-RB16n TaxID=2116687 RepID=UPI00122F5DA8|nr:hypothetical protein [Mesorhizobium sp. SARCC-RB16n]KAA3450598.1 hypothetical protein C7I87_11040 [Mesorhizobium sp. SARCC-RB16n]
MAKALHPETRDVWPRALLLFGLGLLVFLALAAIALKLMFNTAPYWPLGNNGRASEAGPTLQHSPGADLAAFRKQEDEELGKLAWVDRGAGIARIPIEDAMKLIAARGLPDWASAAALPVQDCGLLEGQVPRAAQAGNCHAGSFAARPNDKAPQPRQNAPAMGASP